MTDRQKIYWYMLKKGIFPINSAATLFPNAPEFHGYSSRTPIANNIDRLREAFLAVGYGTDSDSLLQVDKLVPAYTPDSDDFIYCSMRYSELEAVKLAVEYFRNGTPFPDTDYTEYEVGGPYDMNDEL